MPTLKERIDGRSSGIFDVKLNDDSPEEVLESLKRSATQIGYSIDQFNQCKRDKGIYHVYFSKKEAQNA